MTEVTRKLASTDMTQSIFPILKSICERSEFVLYSYKDVDTFRLHYRPQSFTMVSSKMIILLFIGASVSASDFFIDLEESDGKNPLDFFIDLDESDSENPLDRFAL